jgi:arabinofuranosyltransferase
VALSPLPLGLAFATMGAVALSSPVPNLTATAFFFTDRWERRTLLDERGITDERAIYYRYTGLMTARRGEPMPNHHLALQGRRMRAEGRRLIEHGQIGILGFHAGPGLHILDSNSLTDAFLVRLPVAPGWRIGHFGRKIPFGYEGTLRTGVNRLTDPSLRALYRKVAVVTRGALFDRERLATVWDLNFGAGRHVVDEYFAAHAGVQKAALTSLSAPKQDGADPLQGTRRFSEWGLEVELGRVRHPLALELSLDQNDVYRLVCLKQGVALAERQISPRIVPDGGLSLRRVELDRKTARWGCDVLRILPVNGDQDYRLGHVAILDELADDGLGETEPLEPQAAPSEPPGDGEERKQDDRLPGGR